MLVNLIFYKVNLNSVLMQSFCYLCCISFSSKILNIFAVYNIQGFTVITEISAKLFCVQRK
jgi:hypothetical protein